MSDDEGGHEEKHESGGTGLLGMLHAGAEMAWGAASGAIGAGAGAMGAVLGPAGVALGVHELGEAAETGDVTKGLQGGLGVVGGAAGTIEGIGTFIEAALGGGEAVAAGGAAAEAGAAGAGAGLGLGSVAPLAAAGIAGLAAGTGIASAADSKYAQSSIWGTDEATGKNNTAMDVASNFGHWIDRKTGDGSPSVLGGVGAGLASIPMGAIGALQAGGNWVGSLFD